MFLPSLIALDLEHVQLDEAVVEGQEEQVIDVVKDVIKARKEMGYPILRLRIERTSGISQAEKEELQSLVPKVRFDRDEDLWSSDDLHEEEDDWEA